MNTLRIRIGLIAGLLIALDCAVMAADKPTSASEFFFKEAIRKSLVIQPHAVELVPVVAAAESRPGSNRD